MENNVVSNLQNEMLFIGTLFKCNDLFLEYEKVIISKYYFLDEFCLNSYEWMSVLYNNGQTFSEKNITVYVSQNTERLSLYKKYGGWKTVEGFMLLADETDFKVYFQTIQKFALLRELEGKGFDTTKIRSLKGFDKATTNDIYNKVRKEIDNIHTSITSDIEVIDIAKDVYNMMYGYLERPSLGTLTFLPTYNDLLRGFRGKSMMAVGYPGNAGKTRFLAKIVAYNALIKKQKSLIMVNEMSEEELRLAILTTVINNPEFQELHGVVLEKNEKEIALGIYHNDDGEFIYRNTNDENEFTETIPEYELRLLQTSKEYRDVSIVSKWIEENSLDKYMSVVNVSKDYTDVALETCIRKNARKGFKFFAYDNLKNEKQNLGDWSALIRTTTVLSETAKDEDVFVYGSIQLTDDVNDIWDVFKLNSMNIAASKGLRTVLDILILGKEIDKDKYNKYRYIPTTDGYGENSKLPLPLDDKGHNWKLFAHVVDKNRYGSKEIILVEVELNKNLWIERGILIRA